jgi:secreted trypsin-like serine protease
LCLATTTTTTTGGPLQLYNDKQVKCTYTQIGVVSFGLKQCGTIGTPGVFVNVFHYLDWIEGIVWSGEN